MSTTKMLDMCVKFIARRHHMLTEEHVAMLDEIWSLYEPQDLPPLPPSPPPERQHVHFVEYERPDKEERPKRPSRSSWPCDRCINDEVWECGRCEVRQPTQEEVEKEERRQEQEQEEGRRLSQQYVAQQEELVAAARRRVWEDAYGKMNESRRKWEELEQERQERQKEQDHQDACDCSDCEYEDSEWEEKRQATMADFATLKKEADYQAQLQEEADEQAEYYRQQREEEAEEQAEYYRQQKEEHERSLQADALWRQVPQGVPVSQSMQHKETCGCDTCDWQDRRRVEEEHLTALQQEAEEEYEEAQWRWREHHERRQERIQEEYEQERWLPSCSDYLRTCDADGCRYECSTACGSSPPPMKQEPADAYPLPPIESCLYGCAFSCGAKQGQECIAQFDGQGNQLPPVVEAVVNAAIDSDDEMPPLISISALPKPKGWYNPEEEDQTLIVNLVPPQPTKPPKAKTLFHYNHHLWPSPRAKALVQWMIRRGRTSKEAVISYALKEGGEPIKTLTHDICMSYLAKYYGLRHEQLLEKSIYELHNPDPHTPYWQICKCPFCKSGYMRSCGYRY